MKLRLTFSKMINYEIYINNGRKRGNNNVPVRARIVHTAKHYYPPADFELRTISHIRPSSIRLVFTGNIPQQRVFRDRVVTFNNNNYLSSRKYDRYVR